MCRTSEMAEPLSRSAVRKLGETRARHTAGRREDVSQAFLGWRGRRSCRANDDFHLKLQGVQRVASHNASLSAQFQYIGSRLQDLVYVFWCSRHAAHSQSVAAERRPVIRALNMPVVGAGNLPEQFPAAAEVQRLSAAGRRKRESVRRPVDKDRTLVFLERMGPASTGYRRFTLLRSHRDSPRL
jgi:hypothetical protein